MQEDQYLTIGKPSQGLYKEKGSKFIAIAIPVNSVEEAKSHLEKIRKQFHDARHHCFAYKIGKEHLEYRYNDDGEPSGTAGRPIFGQIESFGLTNTLIVVVRYFGGVKLGTGGLVQAYRMASKNALDQARMVVKTEYASLTLNFPYTAMNDVMRIIKEEDLSIRDQEYTLEGNITVMFRKSKFDLIRAKFSSIQGIITKP
jgi:uncharacterized YigZ family protein